MAAHRGKMTPGLHSGSAICLRIDSKRAISLYHIREAGLRGDEISRIVQTHNWDEISRISLQPCSAACISEVNSESF